MVWIREDHLALDDFSSGWAGGEVFALDDGDEAVERLPLVQFAFVTVKLRSLSLSLDQDRRFLHLGGLCVLFRQFFPLFDLCKNLRVTLSVDFSLQVHVPFIQLTLC